MDEVDELDADEDDEDAGGKLKGGKPLKTLYELNDTLFAEAEVDEDGNVGLWLGVSLQQTRCIVSTTHYLSFASGQHHAVIPPRRSRSVAIRKARCCQAIAASYERGSRVPERADHGDGSQFRQGAQREFCGSQSAYAY